MAKAKGKAKGKAKAKAAAVTMQEGDRVRVLHGDWGNARGVVLSVSGGTAAVKLDADAHNSEKREFACANLAPALGHFDR